jgi:transposase
MNTSKTYTLGIDISKKHFDVALLLDDNKQKHKKFTNHSKGFQELTHWLKQFNIKALHACMEATNIYGNALAEYLYDRGYDVSIVNPARIKGFAQSELLRTKTDKQDASLIARFCVAMQPMLWEPEPQKVRELKGLVRRVDALMEMKQQEVNRLEVAEQIVMDDIKQHINSLSDRIDQLRQLIADHIDNDPSLRKQKELLLSIPVIGEKTVAVLLSYFSSIHRFSHAKKLAAFCGVIPRAFDSGSSINKYWKEPPFK